jgi:hypothetical protein
MQLLPRGSRLRPASRRSFRPHVELLDERALPSVSGLSGAGSLQAPLGSAFSPVLASFSSADVSGPSLAAALPHLHAQINWGDGHGTGGTINGPDAAGNLFVTGTNTYQAAQVFPVTVSVTDDRDQSQVSTLDMVSTVPGGLTGGLASLPITGAGGTLSVTPSPVSATAGQVFTGILGLVRDSNPGANLAAVIDWGDGTRFDVVMLQPTGSPGVFAIVDSHFYPFGGSSTVGIWVQDLNNGQTAFTSTPVTVANGPTPAPAPAGPVNNPGAGSNSSAGSHPREHVSRPFHPITEAEMHFYGFWDFTHPGHRRFWHRFTMYRPAAAFFRRA